jgi:carbonic anhydrase/acetyltransferase-like protein (isoleucine patch superfamily)
VADCLRRVFNYYKLKIADCVDVGERCVVEALSIGKGVKIGDDCTIVSFVSTTTDHISDPSPRSQGKFTVIGDYAIIDPNSILPPLSVIPALTHWSGNPGAFSPLLTSSLSQLTLGCCCGVARMIGDVPETRPEIVDAGMRAEYKRYKMVKSSSGSAGTQQDGKS